jgi:hypothetical protein
MGLQRFWPVFNSKGPLPTLFFDSLCALQQVHTAAATHLAALSGRVLVCCNCAIASLRLDVTNSAPTTATRYG